MHSYLYLPFKVKLQAINYDKANNELLCLLTKLSIQVNFIFIHVARLNVQCLKAAWRKRQSPVIEKLQDHLCCLVAEIVISQDLLGLWCARRCTSSRTCGSMTLEAAGESDCVAQHWGGVLEKLWRFCMWTFFFNHTPKTRI